MKTISTSCSDSARPKLSGVMNWVWWASSAPARPDTAAEITKADLVLNLSESESFSMVCLEALKAGAPLVASDCGGPGEIIEHMRSGWLVPNRDVVAAADAIETLATDRGLRNRFRLEGRKRARSKFDVRENARQLSGLYSALSNHS